MHRIEAPALSLLSAFTHATAFTHRLFAIVLCCMWLVARSAALLCHSRLRSTRIQSASHRPLHTATHSLLSVTLHTDASTKMDEVLQLVNDYFVDPYILGVTPELNPAMHERCPWPASYSWTRQILVMYGFLYVSSLALYYGGASCTYYLFYTENERAKVRGLKGEEGGNGAFWRYDRTQVFNECLVSTWSLAVMALITVGVEMPILCGAGRVYYSIAEYGWAYFLISPILFLMFTDTLIYWIHRGLHHPRLYFLHKLHHKYKETTPFSAFSFHPLDGIAQGMPYHLFTLVFPMHSRLYLFTLFMVGLWTVNIHDRVTLDFWGVNGAAHHTIHHTKFNYNYGQYFTFWDRFFGTFSDPHQYWYVFT